MQLNLPIKLPREGSRHPRYTGDDMCGPGCHVVGRLAHGSVREGAKQSSPRSERAVSENLLPRDRPTGSARGSKYPANRSQSDMTSENWICCEDNARETPDFGVSVEPRFDDHIDGMSSRGIDGDCPPVAESLDASQL